uniref:Uncharacterized protein n=1 Tax=Brassica campestris TaxID=3711 RepID=M4EFD7_BRACM
MFLRSQSTAAPISTAARDAVRRLFHLSSPTVSGGETVGGEIERFSGKMFVVRFSEATCTGALATKEWSTGGADLDEVHGGAIHPSIGAEAVSWTDGTYSTPREA